MKKLLTLAVLALLLGAPHAHANDDGTPSTGSLTVVTSTNLVQASATGSVVIVDTISLAGSWIYIGPYQFMAGRDFTVGATLAATATNLAAAINANVALPVSASANSVTITLTADNAGAGANSIGLRTSNTAEMTVSGATLTGGLNNATITINATTLVQGRDWFAYADSSSTARSIEAAINRAPMLSPIISGYWSGGTSGVVNLRSTLVPAAYSLSVADNSLTNANLTPSGSAMTAGTAGNLAINRCYLGAVNALPTSGYPPGCLLYLNSDATHIYVSTEPVVGTQSWLAK